MLRTELKTAMAVLLGLGVIAFGGGLLTYHSAVAQPVKADQTGAKPPAKDREAVEKDMKKVQGTWKMIYAEYKGQRRPVEEVATNVLVMSGDKCTLFKAEDKIHEHGGFRLDPTRHPKAIDITEDEGPLKGQSNRGIYLLEDDLFILCYNEPDMERPTHFTSKPTASIYLFIYKRDKP